MQTCYIISILIIIVGLFLLILDMLLKDKKLELTKRKEPKDICILIPARDESKVIEDLILSIKKSSHRINMKDVLITIGICILTFIIGELAKPIYAKLFRDYQEVN